MFDFSTASESLFLSSDGLVSCDIHRDASLSHGIGVETFLALPRQTSDLRGNSGANSIPRCHLATLPASSKEWGALGKNHGAVHFIVDFRECRLFINFYVSNHHALLVFPSE